MHKRWNNGVNVTRASSVRSPEPTLEERLSRSLVIPSGSTPVRSLTGKFNGEEHDADLQLTLRDQRREIERLRKEVAVKDGRIRQLEKAVLAAGVIV